MRTYHAAGSRHLTEGTCIIGMHHRWRLVGYMDVVACSFATQKTVNYSVLLH